MRFETEVDSLYYGTIENAIAEHYDLGYPSSSNFPIEFSDDSKGIYTLSGTKGTATFYICVGKKTNGNYDLSVSCNDKIKRKK